MSADSLCAPFGVALDAHGNLYVADRDNNRVLEYDKPVPFGGGTPGTPGAAGDITADLVLGQSGAFDTAACNGGGPLSATSLCAPVFLSIDPFGSLFVTDFSNNRVLAYAEPANPPTNVTATLEFGQGVDGTDFTHGTANTGGLSANSLDIAQFNRPPGVANDSAGNLYVADVGNARLLEYDGPFLGTPTTTTSTSTTTSSVTPTTQPPTTSTSSTTTSPPSTTTTAPTTTTTAPKPTTTSTTSSSVTTTTLLTVLPPAQCPDAEAAAAIEAEVEAQCHCRDAANHGAFVRCATKVAKAAVEAGTLPKHCKGAVTACAKRSVCGKPGFVTCCRTSAKGKTRCSTKSGASLCKPTRHGTACVGQRPSCCDACTSGGCADMSAEHSEVQ